VTVCPSCQYDNVDDRDFCRECGAYLKWDEPTEEVSATPAAPEPEPVESEAPTVVLPPPPKPEPEPVVPAEPVAVTFKQPGDAGRAGGPVAVRVEPAGEATLIAVVRNQSGIVDNYDLRLMGWPEEWWTVSPPTVHLVPAGAESGTPEQEVVVRLHPPRSPQAEARAWAVKLSAISVVQHSVVASAAATVEIAPYEQFEMRIRPERAHGEGTAEYAIPVRNLGNGSLALAFTGEDPDDEVRFGFSPAMLNVPAGGESRTMLRVSAPRPRGGEVERERRLTIVAEGDHESRSVAAAFAQAPLVTPTRVRSWRWLIALAAALLIAIGSFMSWTDDGLKGICTNGADNCLRYDVFAQRYLDSDPGAPDAGQLTRAFSFVTSVGILTLLLAAIVLLGVRTGGAAWFGGIATILLLIVYLVIAGTSGPGVWVAMLGGVLAVVAGLLATRTS
jgi:uncharacterized membrane protein YkgB